MRGRRRLKLRESALRRVSLIASAVELLSPADATGTGWEVVLIEVGFSKNRGETGLPRYYTESALRKAVREGVFNGVKATTFRFGGRVIGDDDEFNHQPDAARESGKSFIENQIGFYENIRFGPFVRQNGTKGIGVLARMVILEGAKSLRENMVDAFRRGRADLYALSIDADGAARVGVVEGRRAEVVTEITGASSTDIVSEPAAGGGLLRLVASLEGEASMKWKKLLEALRQRRPGWFKQVPTQAPEQADQDYLTHICESAVSLVEDDIVQAENQEATLKAAEDLRMLKTLMGLLTDGKVEDAMKILQDAVASSDAPQESEDPPAATPPPPAPPATIQVQPVGVEEATAALSAGAAAGAQQIVAAGQAAANAQAGTQAQATLAEAVQINAAAKAALADIQAIQESAKIQSSKTLVESVVKGSNLHPAAADRIIESFVGRNDVTEQEVKDRVVREKEYLAQFSEGNRPIGLGDSHSTVVTMPSDKLDKLNKAMYGMIENEDQDGIPKFTSLAESWMAFGLPFGPQQWLGPRMFTSMGLAFPRAIQESGWGDENDPVANHLKSLKESWSSRAPIDLRESVTTADWAVAFGDALFRRLQREYVDDPLNDWKAVAEITSLSDWTNKVKIIRHGAVDKLLPVNEQAPYQELAPPTPTEEVQEIEPNKFGGLRQFTMEDVMADRLSVFRRIPRDLARSSMRTIHELVWDIFENNTVIQGNPLVSVANSNLVAGNPALSHDNVGLAVRLLRDQTELGSGKKLGLRPAWLITGSKLERLAIEITDSRSKQNAGEDATVINVVQKWGIKPLMSLGLAKTVAKENFWWVTADKRDAEQIAIGFPGGKEKPDIFVQGQGQQTQGSMFDSDTITFKIRQIIGVTPVDHRGIAGSQTP